MKRRIVLAFLLGCFLFGSCQCSEKPDTAPTEALAAVR